MSEMHSTIKRTIINITINKYMILHVEVNILLKKYFSQRYCTKNHEYCTKIRSQKSIQISNFI